MGIRNKKRGLTLIEVLISMAIFGIIIVPISSMVLTSVNLNKKSQDKQQGTYIAQKVLEIAKFQSLDTKDKLKQYLIDNSDIKMVVNNAVNPNKGFIYYTSDGKVADSTNYAYKIEVNLSDDIVESSATPLPTVENGIEINTPNNLKCFKNSNVEPTINGYDTDKGIKISISSGGTNSYDLVVTSGANSISYTGLEYLSFSLNFNCDLKDDQSLKVLVDNETNETLNLNVNIKDNLNPQYNIISTWGRVNQILNNNPKVIYSKEDASQVKNLVKIDMSVYSYIGKDKPDKKLTDVEGFKDLGE